MNTRCFAASLAALAVSTLPVAAQNQPISAKGHWHVDFRRSLDPWASHPKSVILDVIIDDERMYEATETIVGTDGKVRTETIRAAFDGKPYAVEGSPNGVTVAMRHLVDGSLRAELETPDGFRALIICRFSSI
jgi:hypothetical protein